MRRHARRRPVSIDAPLQIDQADVSLLDVIDHVLNQGVVISGEVTIGVADVDLIYLQLQALLCSADRAHASSAAIQPVSTRRRHR